MLHYKLRTLLILLAILPPLLAVGWWKYSAWKAEQERLRRVWTLSGQKILTAQPYLGPQPVPQPKAPAKAGEQQLSAPTIQRGDMALPDDDGRTISMRD